MLGEGGVGRASHGAPEPQGALDIAHSRFKGSDACLEHCVSPIDTVASRQRDPPQCGLPPQKQSQALGRGIPRVTSLAAHDLLENPRGSGPEPVNDNGTLYGIN